MKMNNQERTDNTQQASLWGLLKGTAVSFGRDNCTQLAAALSYYAVFSLAPILFLVVAVFGFLGGSEDAVGYISQQVEAAAGPQASEFLMELVSKAFTPATGYVATALAMGTLLLTATTFLLNLQKALNLVWNVQQAKSGGIKAMLKDRVRSLFLILIFGLLLFLSLAANTIIQGAEQYLLQYVDSRTLSRIDIGQQVGALVLMTLMFTMVFRLLPNAVVRVWDALVGGLITALLFSLGKELISLYLARASLGVYGPASAAIALLMWINYSAMIFLLGAEFTQQFAAMYGKPIRARSRPRFEEPEEPDEVEPDEIKT